MVIMDIKCMYRWCLKPVERCRTNAMVESEHLLSGSVTEYTAVKKTFSTLTKAVNG